MTTKRIVYKRADGGTSIVGPAPRRINDLMAEGMTEDQAIAVIQARSVPVDATNTEVMDMATIPVSREFRDAWVKPPVGPPTVNMPKAHPIHMGRIRAVRDIELTKLDVEYMRADESGNQTEKARIGTLKQSLRGIPQTFDLEGYNTPEELSAAWPTNLPRPKDI